MTSPNEPPTKTWQLWHFRIQLWPTYSAALRAPSSLTKCFTLTHCSEGIRDLTGINKKPPKAVESGKTMAPRVFQYLLLKWQILLVKTKHVNCVQTATLSYSRTMRWQRKNSISLYHATKLCVSTLILSFQLAPWGLCCFKTYTRQPWQMTTSAKKLGNNHYRMFFFFPRCKHYTEKKYSWSTGRKCGTL